MPTAPEEMTLKVIAHIHTAFPTKFGIPRQSGLVEELRGEVVFTSEYRSARRRCAGWKISATSGWCGSFPVQCGTAGLPPCARPVWAGNTRMGVFATRSPLPANPLGLSVCGWKPSSTGRT